MRSYICLVFLTQSVCLSVSIQPKYVKCLKMDLKLATLMPILHLEVQGLKLSKLDKAVSKLCAQSLSGDTGIWD